MHLLEKTVLQTLTAHAMIKKGDTVLLALSGGPDSVCLLRVLLNLAEALDITVAAAHLNHKIRGKEADADEAFVRSLAKEYGVRLVTGKKDVPAAAKKNKMSLEDAAREARYRFLSSAARKTDARVIATGHTADDQAETLLMNLLRGSGRTGLTGIDPVRDGHIIRPLLQVRKTDILAHLKKTRQAFRVDATNTCTDMTRNRIRHQLLPYLKRHFNPQIGPVLARTGTIISAEEAFLARETDRIFNGSLKKTVKNKIVLEKRELLRYNLIFVRRVVRRSLMLLHGSLQGITFGHTETVAAMLKSRGNRIVCLPAGLRVEVRETDVVFRKDGKGTAGVLTLALPGTTVLWDGEGMIRTRIVRPLDVEGTLSATPPHRALVDQARVRGALRVRTRRPGDRFIPLGMYGSKKLKDFLMDAKVSRLDRERVPLVTDDTGIVWVAGMRPAHPFRVTERTTRIIEMVYTETQKDI